jgi:hypothetical protein
LTAVIEYPFERAGRRGYWQESMVIRVGLVGPLWEKRDNG